MTTTDKLAMFATRVPISLHRQLKTLCARKKTSIQCFVIRVLTKAIRTNR